LVGRGAPQRPAFGFYLGSAWIDDRGGAVLLLRCVHGGAQSGDAFDLLYREGSNGSPKLLSIGLHDRLIGRPGRCGGLIKLLEHMRSFDRVWFCRGIDIAQHWRSKFPIENGDNPRRRRSRQ